MAFYSSWLTLVFLATSPLYALLMIVAARVLRPVFLDLEDWYGKYHSYQIDAIKGIETVKALGGESAFRRLLLDQFLGVSGKIFKADFTAMSYEGAIDAVTFLGLGLFLWAGTYQVLGGQLSIGGLVAFNSLVALSTAPIRNLLLLWDNLQRCDVLLNRLDDVFQHEPEQGRDRSALRPVRTLSGSVTLRGVGFRYGGPEAPAILNGITLNVPAGKVVAIVGRSGSGKTTLARCMAGLLEPTEGTILYDGLDLKTLNYRDLRRRIGFVLQDCYVFADTIARNIAFGEEEPDMERVVWAAEVASAHEFIERLPFGYDTRIGETGLALSGGQRQRIAIARAIYHRPPILIFDEATSSLDAEAERAVQHNIDALLEGRTAFVIAHRVSTVQNADLIVVLDRGRLVEQGNHDGADAAARALLPSREPATGGGPVIASTLGHAVSRARAPARGPRAALAWVLLATLRRGRAGARARPGAGDGRRAVRARAGTRRRSRAHAARRHRDQRSRGRRPDGGIGRHPVHDRLRAGRRSHGRTRRARHQPVGR